VRSGSPRAGRKTFEPSGSDSTPTGSVVARDVKGDLLDDNPYPIYTHEIGRLEGQRIPLAGLWGGGLRTTSPDGWVAHRVAPSWPVECAVLCPPDDPEFEIDPAQAVAPAQRLADSTTALPCSGRDRPSKHPRRSRPRLPRRFPKIRRVATPSMFGICVTNIHGAECAWCSSPPMVAGVAHLHVGPCQRRVEPGR
jgi:hypothetical protein